ncbi:MAG: class I SAM-dependent methyltransferase [Thiovulaceae bacterium]|nr:class I SAM-dependent methyltransferase [Sulfurimonadaceae bacterium]
MVNDSCDLVLMVTTICFVDDALQSLKEIYRILQPGGFVIIGFVDRASQIGQFYEQHRKESRFYDAARFYTAEEDRRLLEASGCCVQTIFGRSLQDADTSVREGCGEGTFVAMSAQKRA